MADETPKKPEEFEKPASAENMQVRLGDSVSMAYRMNKEANRGKKRLRASVSTLPMEVRVKYSRQKTAIKPPNMAAAGMPILQK